MAEERSGKRRERTKIGNGESDEEKNRKSCRSLTQIELTAKKIYIDLTLTESKSCIKILRVPLQPSQ